MKAVTIIQPWATLIALGEKKIETRSWRTKHRGNLLIHAGKKIDKEVLEKEPFKSILKKHGINSYKDLPIGVILAKCKLEDCYKVVDMFGESSTLEDGTIISGQELKFGYYKVGRYGWTLKDIEMLDKPIVAQGKLNLWGYDM